MSKVTLSAAGVVRFMFGDTTLGTLKQEFTAHPTYATREEARNDMLEYSEVFTNNKRRHSTCHQTPEVGARCDM